MYKKISKQREHRKMITTDNTFQNINVIIKTIFNIGFINNDNNTLYMSEKMTT